MNKRLRKKKHVKEFQDTYFDLKFELALPENSPEREAFYDEFLSNLIEALGLGASGSLEPEIDLAVGPIGRGKVSPEQKDAICKWLEARKEVSNVQAGSFKDAWYSIEEE